MCPRKRGPLILRVFVYFNLHRRCLSIRAEEGEDRGRVIAHAAAVDMEDVTFVVRAAGRERVLREKRKNVHAGIRGTLCSSLPVDAGAAPRRRLLCKQAALQGSAVTYNPFIAGHFRRRDDGQAVYTARRCITVGRDIVAAG